jgi:hypothetical protein
MKLLTSFFLFVALTVPTFAETIRDEYSEKVEALKKLEGQARAAVNPSGNIVFPQIANGVTQGIAIVSSVVLSSNVSFPLTVTLTFTNEFGGPMALGLSDSSNGNFIGFGSVFTLVISPFRTFFLETDGTGALVEGWGRATSFGASDMGGVAAFQLLNASTLQFITVVGVGASDATISFFTPVFKDDFLNSNTALALANTSNVTAFVKVFLFDNNGGSQTTTLSIGPQQRISLFINEIFPIASRFFGTAHFFRVDSAENVIGAFDVHPVVLLLSNGILSSLPVTNIVPL